MSLDARLDQLLNRWEELRAQNQNVSAEDLCRECPELLPELKLQIEALESMDKRIDLPNHQEASAAAPVGSPDSPGSIRPPDTTPDGPRPRTEWPTIPGYEILDKLAQGGMGVVYKVRQVSLNRVVALKMILAGTDAAPEQRARFRTEAEAVAHLQHANIVQIHEIGESEGRPYFTMEFVDGGSLADKLRGVPQPARPAAALVQILAESMHFAHQQGILHRDLKPGNVLLACSDRLQAVRLGSSSEEMGSYEPKITDFGLAKQLNVGAGLTQTGEIIGTPSYMAPEQAAGWVRAVGPATDVYALGAILYELLTGRPPFRGPTPFDTFDQVRFQEPVPPTSLQPTVPRDLETICLKCLQKEPGKRYATARELADDLQRFLNREPIRARPVSRIERLWRWCRRKPVVASLLAALALVFAVGFGSVAWQWQRAEEQAAAARREREAAERQAERARHNFQKAQEAVSTMLTYLGERGLANVPHMEGLRRELLEVALKFNEGFLEENSTDPAVRQETAEACARMAHIWGMLGQSGDTEKAYRQAIDLYRALAAGFPDRPEFQRALANNYLGLSNVLADARRLPEAEEAQQRVERILEHLPGESRDTPGNRNLLANWHMARAFLLSTAERYSEAESSARQAIALQKLLLEESPANTQYEFDLSNSYNTLGIILKRTKRIQDAVAAYRQSLDYQERLAARFPWSAQIRVHLGVGYRNFGLLLRQNGRNQDAQKTYRQAQSVLEKLVNDFPSVPSYHHELGEAMHGLAQSLIQAEKLADARTLLEQAIDQHRLALQADPQNRTYGHRLRNHFANLAKLLVDMAEHHDASQAATDLAERAGVPWDPCTAVAILAACMELAEKDTRLSAEKRQEAAETYGRQAVAILRKAIPKGGIEAKLLKEDVDFAPLRSREDFQTLLRDLEERAKSGAK
jgi:serine/threonine protein kinase/tetratricopeptide (TPR) repeat protein